MPIDPSDGPDPERLKQFEARLSEAKKALEPETRTDGAFAKANMGWRMVIELVSGLGIGFGIGYGLDALFGTLPLFMMLFTLLGLAAGVRVMLRTAKEMSVERQADNSAGEEGR